MAFETFYILTCNDAIWEIVCCSGAENIKTWSIKKEVTFMDHKYVASI